jgi:hypothetical protein
MLVMFLGRERKHFFGNVHLPDQKVEEIINDGF